MDLAASASGESQVMTSKAAARKSVKIIQVHFIIKKSDFLVPTLVVTE